MTPTVGMESIQQAYGEGTGGTQAGPLGRNISDGRDLNAALDTKQREGLPDERVLDLRRVGNLLCAGIADSKSIIELATHRHVHRPVDGSGKDSATISSVVGR